MFNLSNTPSASTTKHLKANAIHNVTFKGLEFTKIQGKDGRTYQVLDMKFADADGAIFTDRSFEPQPGDDVRKDNNYGYKNPAPVEELQFKFMQLLSAVNPEIYKEVIDPKKKINISGWSKFAEFFIKHTSEKVGTELQIKLLANKDGYAQFPRFVLALNKDNDAYPRTSYIGKTLTFTAKELKTIEEANNAKPTTMPDATDDMGIPESTSSAVDIDVDDIELG